MRIGDIRYLLFLYRFFNVIESFYFGFCRVEFMMNVDWKVRGRVMLTYDFGKFVFKYGEK